MSNGLTELVVELDACLATVQNASGVLEQGLHNMETVADHMAHFRVDLSSDIAFAALAERFDTFEGELDEIRDRTDDLVSLPEHTGARLELVRAQAASLATGELEQALAEIADVQSEVDEAIGSVPDLLREKLEDARTIVTETGQRMKEVTEAAWRESVTEAADTFKEDIKTAAESQLERFKDAASTAKEAMECALTSLRDCAQEELMEAIRQEAEEVINAALTRLEQEVADAIITSQMQVQLTATMAPILPHLAAVRVAAVAIKRYLEIMRMGF